MTNKRKISRKGRRLIHGLLQSAPGYNARAVDDEIARADRTAEKKQRHTRGRTTRAD